MSRRQSTLDFIEACRAAPDIDDIAHLLFGAAADLGVAYIACASHVDPLHAPKGAVSLVNYPWVWLNRFSEMNYAKRDPMFFGAQRCGVGFWWNEFVSRHELARDQKRILAEARECGIANGLTFPIFSPGVYRASCSIVPGPDGVDPLVLPDLQYMALYAHEEARLKSGGPARRDVVLTRRQQQCLALAGRGKSDWAIGQILGISPRTAHNTIEAAKKRFGVSHRTQAVALALFDGHIQIDDLTP